MKPKLEIESPEELSAAIEAVEKLRRKQVRHVGLYTNRLDFPCHQTTREKAFAKAWEEANANNRDIHTGRILEALLGHDLTPEEATAAATVIQWLGTNVGFCWLQDALQRAGYSVGRPA